MGLFGNLFRPNVAELLGKRDQNGLLAALKHRDLAIRWEAVIALNSGVMRPMAWAEVVVLLLKDPASIKVLQSLLLVRNKDISAFAVLGLLWSTDVKYPGAIKPALTALTDSLLAALQDPDDKIREFAARVLGQGGDPRAVEALIAALRDPRGHVREAAAEALATVGDPRAADALIAKFRSDLQAHRQNDGNHEYISVCKAMGQTKHPKIIDELIAAFISNNSQQEVDEHESQILRGGLVALGSVAVDPVLKLLKADIPRVRGAACNVLYHIPDQRAVAPLTELLNDQAEYPGLGWQQKDRVNERAVYALAEIGTPAVDALSKAAASPDNQLRELAKGKLAEITKVN